MLRRFSRLGRFRLVGEKPPVQKLPAQKSPMPKIGENEQKLMDQHNIRKYYGEKMDPRFYTKPPVVSVAKERIEKLGRFVEERALKKIKTIRQAAAKRLKLRKLEYGSKANVYQPSISSKNSNVSARFPKLPSIKLTSVGKKVREKVARLSLTAEKLAIKRRNIAESKMAQKLGIDVFRPKDRPSTFYNKKQDVPAVIRRSKEADFQRTVEQGNIPKGYYNYQNEGNYIKWNRNKARSIFRNQFKKNK